LDFVLWTGPLTNC